jgi:hypothetical protein
MRVDLAVALRHAISCPGQARMTVCATSKPINAFNLS